MVDGYTKIVLTVIALVPIVITTRQWLEPGPGGAQGSQSGNSRDPYFVTTAVLESLCGQVTKWTRQGR